MKGFAFSLEKEPLRNWEIAYYSLRFILPFFFLIVLF